MHNSLKHVAQSLGWQQPRLLKFNSIIRVIVLCGVLLLLQSVTLVRSFAADTTNPIPLFAYYYIWFDPQSWDRAKTDYPVLGRYSSDDRSIMEQHVQWAKNAGITGFIVSWKSTLVLDRRLQLLIDVAEKANFKLWIIYQGLNFSRKPLPVDQIDNDLDYFTQTFASSPVFSSYDRPVVILSGTWEFTPDQIKTITSHHRDQLYILASEHNKEGYLRLASNVDGNAYYWSSVDPATFPNYQEKLDGMAQAVHDHGGLWIAPAAPGFDARLIGGTRIIDRKNGDTFRTELNAAIRSSADAVGLISWNEFSENSYIEPSQKYGTQSLDVLADQETTLPPQISDFDSSEQGSVNLGKYYSVFVLGIVLVFLTASILIVILRHRHQNQ
jgi:hypothetical protein